MVASPRPSDPPPASADALAPSPADVARYAAALIRELEALTAGAGHIALSLALRDAGQIADAAVRRCNGLAHDVGADDA